MASAVSHHEAVERLLSEGSMDILGLMPRASNYTFLVRVRSGREETYGVYKPRAGEAPLWDFPEGTLCRREVAAYVVAKALGWPPVPPTILRDGPEGVGSVQCFVEFDPSEHYFTMQERRAEDFRRVAAFDAVVNNADRKAGHCLLGTDGRIHVIDHGVCFSAEPKLRTVIWEFAGEPLPEDVAADVRRLAADLHDGEIARALGDLLDPDEVQATRARAEALVRLGRFPLPGAGRPYPWPAV
jgi:uncharacterized repeat protein (TIGR03843 family)